MRRKVQKAGQMYTCEEGDMWDGPDRHAANVSPDGELIWQGTFPENNTVRTKTIIKTVWGLDVSRIHLELPADLEMALMTSYAAVAEPVLLG